MLSEELRHAGSILFKQDKYLEALEQYSKAFAFVKSESTSLNIAVCLYKIKEWQ
jgi:hypothetical protein